MLHFPVHIEWFHREIPHHQTAATS